VVRLSYGKKDNFVIRSSRKYSDDCGFFPGARAHRSRILDNTRTYAGVLVVPSLLHYVIMKRFAWRLTGAIVLNPKAYEDVEADTSATLQAMSVVVLSSVAAGVGLSGLRDDHLITIVTVSLLALAVWTLWALLALVTVGYFLARYLKKARILTEEAPA